jgi:hypothetical protein
LKKTPLPNNSRINIRPYQDLRCIMPPEQSPSVGGVYAKL